MSVEELEKAIIKLSSHERARLLRLLAEMDDAEWDRQFEEDVKAGKLDALADEAIAEHEKGLTREL
jgi:hypothetical protein